jgi:uncharacterized protein (TIRG00374 family)
LKKTRPILFGLLISLSSLVIAFWGVKPERLMNAISGAEYIYLFPILFMILLGLLARARSWQILLSNKISIARAFDALNEGYLLNNILPFRLGEVGRAYLVSQHIEIGIGPIMATVVLERLIDASVSFLGLLLALPFVLSPYWITGVLLGVGGLLVVGVGILVIMPSQRARMIRLLQKIPGARFLGLDIVAEGFLSTLQDLSRSPRIIQAGIWSLIAWATAWVQFSLFLRMFRLEGSLFESLFVLGVIAFGAAIPSSPGALGIYELSAMAGLMVFGIGREDALSVAIAAHVVQLAVTSGFGAWALGRDGQSILSLASKVQNIIRRQQNSPAT